MSANLGYLLLLLGVVALGAEMHLEAKPPQAVLKLAVDGVQLGQSRSEVRAMPELGPWHLEIGSPMCSGPWPERTDYFDEAPGGRLSVSYDEEDRVRVVVGGHLELGSQRLSLDDPQVLERLVERLGPADEYRQSPGHREFYYFRSYRVGLLSSPSIDYRDFRLGPLEP